jgi:hypothetical protein
MLNVRLQIEEDDYLRQVIENVISDIEYKKISTLNTELSKVKQEIVEDFKQSVNSYVKREYLKELIREVLREEI